MVISTNAINCLERPIPEMTNNVSNGMLNSTPSTVRNASSMNCFKKVLEKHSYLLLANFSSNRPTVFYHIILFFLNCYSYMHCFNMVFSVVMYGALVSVSVLRHLRSCRHIIRSTPKSRPNNMGQMSVRQSIRQSVHPSTKSFSDSDEIWYVCRGR